VKNKNRYDYLELEDGDKKSFLLSLLTKMGTWILVFTNFVPISLMVSLELVKFWQAMFMSFEWLMYDDEQDMPMKA
jgi:phospholipid-transporting ATPase